MKLGVLGLPGAGKTTLFEALTGVISEEAAHKPEDRLGAVRVPDERVDILSKMYNPKKTIYTQVEYLLPYTATHQANKAKDETSWTSIRTCDALIHVIRNFDNMAGEKPTPEADFKQVDEEMVFADLMVVEKRLERLAKDKKRGRKTDLEEERLLNECREMLENETPLRTNPELAGAHLLKGFTFLSAKPMLVLFNNDDEDDKMPTDTDLPDREQCLAVRGRLEHELGQMSPEDAAEYLEEFEITASAMDRVIAASYELLGLVSFFTVGEDEVRAWTIRKDTAAVDAAEVIHSDIKKGFIRAEVVAYKDLLEAGAYKEARKKGTVRLEGKTYVVENGDIIEFRFNV